MFGVSEYLASQSKKLVEESGIPGLSHGPRVYQLDYMLRRYTIFLMMLHHSTKAERIFSICVATKMIWSQSCLATSHGNRACDGVGGTVKQLVARVSLQRPHND